MIEVLSPTPSEIAQAISDGISRSNQAASVMRENFAMVVRTNDLLVGGVTASVSFSILFINNIWVVEDHRHSGLGSELMIAAENEGIRRGARTTCVDTLSTQAPAFYEKLGYKEFGRVRGSVGEQTLDRIWFSKPLTMQGA